MRIYLRPVELDDGLLIVKWRNTPCVSEHCMDHTPITLVSNEKFYHEKVETGKYIQYIVERIDEEYAAASYPIATCYLKDIDKINKRCELCIFTSDDQEWNTESQAIAIKMLVEKAFNELGMHKIYSYVFYKFLDESNLLRRSGFEIEAVHKSEVLSEEGVFEDVIRFSLINQL